jgi:NADH-quinone oxidoreductase subunit L
MVGPTPVSALLHSATLVAAGAILMIRVSPLLPHEVLLAVGLLGGLTLIVAGSVAVSQRDLKRLLAASTSSQYGLMLLSVGAGSPVAALVHLVAHATMKSSLFLGSGVFQHARGSTEFAELQGVGRARRWTFLGFAVAGLALAGVPPLSGFFSKDAILAASLESPYAPVLAPLAFAGTLLTATYVARALRILWRGDDRTEPVAGIG